MTRLSAVLHLGVSISSAHNANEVAYANRVRASRRDHVKGRGQNSSGPRLLVPASLQHGVASVCWIPRPTSLVWFALISLFPCLNMLNFLLTQKLCFVSFCCLNTLKSHLEISIQQRNRRKNLQFSTIFVLALNALGAIQCFRSWTLSRMIMVNWDLYLKDLCNSKSS